MYRLFSVEALDSPTTTALRLSKLLQTLNYELIQHRDGVELLEEIKAVQPDLVLTNPDLPDAQSFTLCTAIQNDAETEHIPVVFISATVTNEGLLEKSFDAGATDFILLSAADSEIAARLKAALRNRQTIAQSVMLAQQLNKINAELYERNLQVEKELYVARQLQQSLLPPILVEEAMAVTPASSVGGPLAEPTAPHHFSKCHYKDDKLRITGVYIPCDALGGDIYDVIKFQNGSVGVTVADVSGHGVPAGFITAIFKSSFYRTTHTHSAPGNILFHLNNELADIVKTGEYVTAVYCRIRPDEDNPERLMLDYSGAGHPYPIAFNASNGQLSRLQQNGTPLVWIKNMEYPMGTIALEPGDRVLMFTDGVSEMRNVDNQLYGEERLEEAFNRLVAERPEDTLDALVEVLSDFTEGHPLEDDVSVVLIEAL